MNKKTKKILAVCSVLSVIAIIGFTLAKASGYKPNLTITYDSTIISTTPTISTDLTGTVDQQIEIKYKVTPEDLVVTDINTITSKEIVLVLDTSGSMSTQDIPSVNSSGQTVNISRIQALKTAANNFIDKLATEQNVKIGIATYSTNSNYDSNSITLTSSTQTSTLKGKINNLQASGGTNTGDGIRYALNMLNDGTTAKKYVILMSDGEPTFYMYNSKQTSGVTTWSAYDYIYKYNKTAYGYYTQLTNDSTNLPRIGGYGNGDTDGRSLTYASTMAAVIKNSKYSSYEIAYSSGGSADKMKTLATAANGKFLSALDASSINSVFSDIADQIKADYTVENVNFNFTLPTGLEFAGSTADAIINGSNYSQQLPNIIYKLSSDKTKYVADPFYISFKLKASKSGSYTNLGQGFTLTYKGIDGSIITKSIPTVNYNVSSLNLDYNLTKETPSYTGKVLVGQSLQMNYNVQPKDVSVATTRKTKEVVILVDSAYANKSNIISFLNKYENVTDATFSLVVYDTGATLYNFGTSSNPQYFVAATNAIMISDINSISSTNGSNGGNLGEGLRKALFALNNKNDVDRSIVVFGENNPNYYSYVKATDGTTSFYEEIDNNNGSTTETVGAITYGNNSVSSSSYANEVAQKIVDNKNLGISIFCAGDDINDDTLKQISQKSSTEFNKIVSDSDISTLFNFTNSDLILDSRLYEVLPDGVVFDDNTNKLDKSIKLFYKYDNVSKKYIGTPSSVIVNIKTTKPGDFILNNSQLYYKDIEGIELSKSFNSLTIHSELDVVILTSVKQGFYENNSTKGNLEIGESYLTSTASNNVTMQSNLSLGALIKTNSPNTNIVIEVNSDNLDAIDISTGINYMVSQVNDDNTLKDIVYTSSISKSGNKYIITININSGNTDNKVFLVNYKYKLVYGGSYTEDKFNSTYGSNGVDFKNKCDVGDGNPNIFKTHILTSYSQSNGGSSGVPDLF